MIYLKDENFINVFNINNTQYITAYANHVYATPRCFKISENSKGKYIKADVIIKYGDYEKTNVLYLTDKQLYSES